ncbi:zinc finger protein CONSTANS-LIKE 16-like [Euphorbia lathyris]|uniref:zinc finger protein CONSTANS-LIKE 16-like n=1 Tax=Euphorbia lathyris TaxID=212925 RepID=UPI003313BA90
MISNKNVANAFAGKTARACDSCIKKRARWYCAADDAFLCQSCDSSVHSANPLARRHERVRLKTASLKSLDLKEPSWLHGFTRKPRTPRHGAKPLSLFKTQDKFNFVPELGSDEISLEDNDEDQQLLYRVPIFDPFVAQLCTSTTISNDGIESRDSFPASAEKRQDVESLHGFLPSDMDLADFAADVESLLGRGLENESFRMEELGLVECKEEELHEDCNSLKKEEFDVDTEIDMGKEEELPFELSFEYDSATCGEEDEKVERELKKEGDESQEKSIKKKKILLSLDYEGVISAWASQGCPWTTGNRPELEADDECWPHWMGNWGGEQHGYRQYAVNHVMGGGREARVSRYREKRRTRLFSKKIRYQVRKLNAEKRPRMKGRFVKRPDTSLH